MMVEKRVMVDTVFCANMGITPSGEFVVRWQPYPPKSLSKTALELYMRGRNSFLSEALAQMPSLPLNSYRTAEWC